jgi:hypothetical protein
VKKPILNLEVDECMEVEAVLEPVPGQPALPPGRKPEEPILMVDVDQFIEFNDAAVSAPSASEPTAARSTK